MDSCLLKTSTVNFRPSNSHNFRTQLAVSWFNLKISQFSTMNYNIDNQIQPKINLIKIIAANTNQVPVRIVLPYKDLISTNVVHKQLADLSRKIKVDIKIWFYQRS